MNACGAGAFVELAGTRDVGRDAAAVLDHHRELVTTLRVAAPAGPLEDRHGGLLVLGAPVSAECGLHAHRRAGRRPAGGALLVDAARVALGIARGGLEAAGDAIRILAS